MIPRRSGHIVNVGSLAGAHAGARPLDLCGVEVRRARLHAVGGVRAATARRRRDPGDARRGGHADARQADRVREAAMTFSGSRAHRRGHREGDRGRGAPEATAGGRHPNRARCWRGSRRAAPRPMQRLAPRVREDGAEEAGEDQAGQGRSCGSKRPARAALAPPARRCCVRRAAPVRRLGALLRGLRIDRLALSPPSSRGACFSALTAPRTLAEMSQPRAGVVQSSDRRTSGGRPRRCRPGSGPSRDRPSRGQARRDRTPGPWRLCTA